MINQKRKKNNCFGLSCLVLPYLFLFGLTWSVCRPDICHFPHYTKPLHTCHEEKSESTSHVGMRRIQTSLHLLSGENSELATLVMHRNQKFFSTDRVVVLVTNVRGVCDIWQEVCKWSLTSGM